MQIAFTADAMCIWHSFSTLSLGDSFQNEFACEIIWLDDVNARQVKKINFIFEKKGHQTTT